MIGEYGLVAQLKIDALNQRGFLVVISQHAMDHWAVISYRLGEMYWAHDFGSGPTLQDALTQVYERSLRRPDLTGKERIDWIANRGRIRLTPACRKRLYIKSKRPKRRVKKGLL